MLYFMIIKFLKNLERMERVNWNWSWGYFLNELEIREILKNL